MLIRGEYQTPPLLCCVKKGDLRGGGEGEAYSALRVDGESWKHM